jgi:hypothetical protein
VIDRRIAGHEWKYSIDRRLGKERVFDLSADPREDHDIHENLPLGRLNELRALSRAHTSASLEIK